MRIFTILLFALITVSLGAQPYGDCELGDASVDLEAAGVRAGLYNTGGLFWRGGEAQYEVPQGSGLTSIFAAGIWMGGYVSDTLRFAGADYSRWEFWPGPIPENGSPPTAEHCRAHDRMYRVTLEDIARYNDTGEASPDLANWPYDLDAPVIDGDGDPDNYNLEGGDRPAILGGETVWWVMNDRGNEHTWGLTTPIGVDVRVTAFTIPARWMSVLYDVPGSTILDLATFYHYEVTNRNAVPIDSLFAGGWFDADLGDASDDYVGSDSLLSLGFIYNGDELDGSSTGYGFSPPALGVTILDGLSSNDLHGYLSYNGSSDPQDGNPGNGQETYNYLNMRWRNGSLITRGGFGTDQSNPPTRYMFPDEPGEFWSEGCPVTNCTSGHEPGDWRFVTSTGPVDVPPGETVAFDFAIVWSRSDQGHLASVARLKSDVQVVRDVYDSGLLFTPSPVLQSIRLGDLPGFESPPDPRNPETYALAAESWPNPVTTEAIIRYDLPEAATIRLSVYDVRGREVAVLVEGAQEAGFHEARIDASAWPNGVYLYRLDAGNRRKATGVFTVLRQ